MLKIGKRRNPLALALRRFRVVIGSMGVRKSFMRRDPEPVFANCTLGVRVLWTKRRSDRPGF